MLPEALPSQTQGDAPDDSLLYLQILERLTVSNDKSSSDKSHDKSSSDKTHNFTIAHEVRDLIPPSKFKNSTGLRYTQGLFLEYADSLDTVLYTLKDYDHRGYPSLYRLYMEFEDPFEFSFANQYFDSYDHWLSIAQSSWLEPSVTKWRHELELKLLSKALAATIADSRSTSRSSAASRRFLLERGWSDKTKRGRPSRAEVRAEAKRLAEATSELTTDLQRISTKSTSPTNTNSNPLN